jgi:hypothetical protein
MEMSDELLSDSSFVGTWNNLLNGGNTSDARGSDISSHLDIFLPSEPIDSPPDMADKPVQALTSLRNRNRRRTHGSAVVVSSQKIQKYLEEDKDAVSSTVLFDSDIVDAAEGILEARKIQFTLIKAAIKIQKIWKYHIYKQLRLQLELRYLQDGKWTKLQSDKVFGLILGWRVRSIMRCNRMKKSIDALNDVYKVLVEIISFPSSSTTSSSAISDSSSTHLSATENKATDSEGDSHRRKDAIKRVHMFDTICEVNRCQNKINVSGTSFSSSEFLGTVSYEDKILIERLVKEALLKRAVVHSLIFSKAVWCLIPIESRIFNDKASESKLSEGYWDFSSAIKHLVIIMKIPTVSSSANTSIGSISHSPKKGNILSPIRSVSLSQQEYQARLKRENTTHSDPEEDNLQLKKRTIFNQDDDAEFDESQSPPLLRKKEIKEMEIDGPSSSHSYAVSINEDILEGIKLSDKLKTNTAAAVIRERNLSIVQSQLASLRANKKVAVLNQRRGSTFQNFIDSSASIAAISSSNPMNLSMGSAVQINMNTSRDSHGSRLEGFRASIELNIMHAEKLMPAKKVYFYYFSCNYYNKTITFITLFRLNLNATKHCCSLLSLIL